MDRIKLARRFPGRAKHRENPDVLSKHGAPASTDSMSLRDVTAIPCRDTYSRFKPATRKRTTVTLGDSFNSERGRASGVLTRINTHPEELNATTGKPTDAQRREDGLDARSYSKLTDFLHTTDVDVQLDCMLAISDLASDSFIVKVAYWAIVRDGETRQSGI
ncbi:MAG: hypothetical protein OXG33_11875 [Chloroflexi bacterium]|nr:hypothetical protein [Chloroflexota bacterium]